MRATSVQKVPTVIVEGYHSTRCQACSQVVQTSEVNRIHSRGSSPSGAPSSHTPMTQTGKAGSLLRRGSWRGGSNSRCVHSTRERERGGTGFVPMPSRKIKRTLILPGRRSDLLKERPKSSLLGLNTPILRRTHDKMGLDAPAHVTAHLAAMREIQVRRILHEQNQWQAPSAGVSVANAVCLSKGRFGCGSRISCVFISPFYQIVRCG
jgi:hypothetical protein